MGRPGPSPGGVFAVDIGGAAARGTYLSVEPPTRVVFTWRTPGSTALPPGSSTVEIVLTAADDETVVEPLHHDLPASQLPSHRTGWATFLAALQHVAH